jgi:hypothetical protein
MYHKILEILLLKECTKVDGVLLLLPLATFVEVSNLRNYNGMRPWQISKYQNRRETNFHI